jgi:hypothetical protein
MSNNLTNLRYLQLCVSKGVGLEFVKVENYASSAWPTGSGSLVIVSKAIRDRFDLLHVQNIDVKGRVQPFLRQQIVESKQFSPLDPLELRANVSSTWGGFLTQHVLKLHESLALEIEDVVADTAWRYSTLVAWGEASAARELSLELAIPVRTIQNRLRIARERGILSSPGPGSRLGK